jgi:DNA-binding LacI/PurR family transcriptional regulator
MDEILLEGNLPRAVICAYDNIAIGAMKRLSEAGLSVPGDVAIIGMDDVPLCEYLNPSLSSVKNTVREAMEFACEAIVNRIFGKPCEMNKTFEGEFIPRESSEIR